MLAAGMVERIGLPGGQLEIRDADKQVLSEIPRDFSDHSSALQAAFAALQQLNLPRSADIGALTAVLGGLDTLVFTGGIGEWTAPVRWEMCQGLEFLGIQLDPQRNNIHADPHRTSHSRCAVRVIPTNEDLMIAQPIRDVIFPD